MKKQPPLSVILLVVLGFTILLFNVITNTAQSRSYTQPQEATISPDMTITVVLPTLLPESAENGIIPTPFRITDLAPNVLAQEKGVLVIRHIDGTYEEFLIAPGQAGEFLKDLPPGDIVVSSAPPESLMGNFPSVRDATSETGNSLTAQAILNSTPEATSPYPISSPTIIQSTIPSPSNHTVTPIQVTPVLAPANP